MAKFMRKGITKVYFAPTIAAGTGIPTAAEITAGTALTAMISEINGFTFSNSPIEVPDMSSAFVSKIPGEDSTDTASIVFYEDKTTNPIQTALAKDVAGYIVFYPRGTAGTNPASGDYAQSWAVIVGSNARMYTASNEAAKYTVVFTNTASPKEGAMIA